MEITTKYNKGETVYYMLNNELKSSPVLGIKIRVFKDDTITITYSVYDEEYDDMDIVEFKLFSSVEELVESIVNEFKATETN